MPELILDSCLSTGLNPAFASVSRIELEPTILGEGGFGVAYRELSVDGSAPSVAQVVKILKDTQAASAQRGLDTIQALQKRLAAKDGELRRRSGRGLLETYPALLGVPQFSFSARLNGRRVVGFSANNLIEMGFEDFGPILEDDVRLSHFRSAPLQSRLEMAMHLAEGFDFLNKQCLFLHADFKAEALFVDTARARCAIIDFDSGAVALDPSDKPTTCGTQQDWLAPEIYAQLGVNSTNHIVKVDALSDAWSVNVGIHCLLLGLPPLFFLTEISQRSVDAYLKAYRWPDAGATFPFFDRSHSAHHAEFRRFIAQHVPREIRERFEATVNRGYFSPIDRTTPGQWAAVLAGALRPAIRKFEADRYLVDRSRPVHLEWEATGVGTVSIAPYPGNVTGRTSVDVPLSAETTFTLTVTSPRGHQVAQQLRVEVATAPPVVLAFCSDKTEVADHRVPARLTWTLAGFASRLTIDHGVGDVTGQSFVDVLPSTDTTYRLKAENSVGASEAVLVVRVSRMVPVVDFRADREFLSVAGPVNLTWDVSANAQQVILHGHGPVASRGSLQVSPRCETTYRLSARTYWGGTTERTITVKVSKAAPNIRSFNVTPTFLRGGGECIVTWDVTGASEVRIDPNPGIVASSASHRMTLGASETFSLTAISDFGVISQRRVAVNVWTPATLQTKPTTLLTVPVLLLREPARLLTKPTPLLTVAAPLLTRPTRLLTKPTPLLAKAIPLPIRRLSLLAGRNRSRSTVGRDRG